MNILFIMSDDQGYWAMGCAGNDEIITPNIDKLAQRGILFKNFFCASPVCSPARASIFTGKIPSQHGVHDWISGGHASHSEISEDIMKYLGKENIPWEYQWPLHQFQVSESINYLEGHKTFTEILAENGYKCGISGKWHLGNNANPQAGFTYWKTTGLGGENYYYPTVVKDGKVTLEKNKYVTDYITENALSYIDECAASNDDKPFFLSVHYTAPHAPWGREHHPEEIYSLYNDCEFKGVPYEKPHPWAGGSSGTEEEELKKRKEFLQGYYTAMTAMDNGIGEIIDRLEKYGILDNTLIIFTSDNGMNMGHHGIWGKGNGTFPQNMYDTSVKVPMIISRCGSIKEGEVYDELFSHYDLMPTILEYTGISSEIDESLPGKSFASLLKGEQMKHREEVVIMDEYGPVRMIRTKEWKYVHRYPYGPNELYNLVNDINEKNNLIDDESKKEILENLKGKLEKWFVKYTDPLVDGRNEPVVGLGQINLAGIKNGGEKAFVGEKTPIYD